jgi:hypothetical protein
MKCIALLILCVLGILILFPHPFSAKSGLYFHHRNDPASVSGDSSAPNERSLSSGNDPWDSPASARTNPSQTLGMTSPLCVLGVSLIAPGLVSFAILFFFDGSLKRRWRGYWNVV